MRGLYGRNEHYSEEMIRAFASNQAQNKKVKNAEEIDVFDFIMLGIIFAMILLLIMK